MKMPAALFLAIALTGCAFASVSQPIITSPMLNGTTVGGVGYPLIVEGAASVGLDPVIVAQNMRFPNMPGVRGSFRAIDRREAPSTHAHLHIRPGQPFASSTLTFVHGTKRIGVGTFSIASAAYGDPRALGSVSSILIWDMLIEAAGTRSDECMFLRPC